MPSSNLILCRPLLLLPPVPPSIRVFSNESTLSVRWPKHWSFSLSISPSNEHFRMNWLDLLAVQGTLKSLLQHHSSKASVLHSAFYSPTLTSIHDNWKTIALSRWTFLGKVMSLLFNMLCMLVITFLPRSLDYYNIEWFASETEIILSFLRLHPSTAFCTLLLTIMVTPFLLRHSCPQQWI